MKTEKAILESIFQDKNRDPDEIYNSATGPEQDLDIQRLAVLLYSIDTVKRYDQGFISEILRTEKNDK